MSDDLDQWWRRLGSAALVGTARRAAPSVADLDLGLDVGGGRVLGPRPDARPEEAALDAAAVGAALRRAGRLPTTTDDDVPAAPPEVLPEAPARARQLLELLVHQPPTDTAGTEELLVHWCAVCRATGHRVPHRSLPALLDRATSERLRTEVAGVVGERGAWLAAQLPTWDWLPSALSLRAALDGVETTFAPLGRALREGGPAEPVDPGRWALLGTDQRVAQLTRVRQTDPAAGRELMLSTWASDSAKDRRALLEALETGLGVDDDGVLEAALDDRAATVRDLAARLLDALPESRRAARMAERLRPLVVETGRLRKQLEVRLPDDPDAAARRDGLGKPPARVSARGWWLERIVAGSPFTVWSAPPATVVRRLEDRDVLAGLRRAAAVRRDVAWARALLQRGPDPDLLAVLPLEEREDRVLAALESTHPSTWPRLLATLPLAWSPRLSVAVVRGLAAVKPDQVAVSVIALLPRLVRGLHPDAVGALQTWRASARLPQRLDEQLGSLILSRTLRQTISEAFDA